MTFLGLEEDPEMLPHFIEWVSRRNAVWINSQLHNVIKISCNWATSLLHPAFGSVLGQTLQTNYKRPSSGSDHFFSWILRGVAYKRINWGHFSCLGNRMGTKSIANTSSVQGSKWLFSMKQTNHWCTVFISSFSLFTCFYSHTHRSCLLRCWAHWGRRFHQVSRLSCGD